MLFPCFYVENIQTNDLNPYIYISNNKQNNHIMQVIETTTINGDQYQIQLFGESNFYVVDCTDTAIGRFPTLRRAKNFLKKVQG